MNKILTFITVIFFLNITNSLGQSISPEVIANSGAYSESLNFSLSWTVGECITETYDIGDLILNQGFHQDLPDSSGVRIPEINNFLNLIVYPNPASDYIKIKKEGKSNQLILISIVSIEGKMLYKSVINEIDCIINIKNLKPGLYIINFHNDDYLFNSVKLIKYNH
jgi:hypothetical protein